MVIVARLKRGESQGDRIMKVNHAGEHGAICIYSAQRWIARWRAPEMRNELGLFCQHERQHRAIFASELSARGRGRCRSFHLCGIGCLILGIFTGLAGRHAIAATTVAIERVVLQHMHEQLAALRHDDRQAANAIAAVIDDEQAHHDGAARRIPSQSRWPQVIDPVVGQSTALVIWLGMHL